MSVYETKGGFLPQYIDYSRKNRWITLCFGRWFQNTSLDLEASVRAVVSWEEKRQSGQPSLRFEKKKLFREVKWHVEKRESKEKWTAQEWWRRVSERTDACCRIVKLVLITATNYPTIIRTLSSFFLLYREPSSPLFRWRGVRQQVWSSTLPGAVVVAFYCKRSDSHLVKTTFLQIIGRKNLYAFEFFTQNNIWETTPNTNFYNGLIFTCKFYLNLSVKSVYSLSGNLTRIIFVDGNWIC